MINCKNPPKYCYFRHGRWVYVDYKTGQKMKEFPLRDGRKLLREDCPCSVIHSIVESIGETPSDTITFLLDRYLKSDYVQGLSLSTNKGYSYYYQTLTNMPMKNGKTFGDMPYELVTPGIIRLYFDKRLTQGVTTGANREIELLSAAFNWSKERDLATKNPCLGVKHIKETAKKVYISDFQYSKLLELTKNTPLYYAIEITYLCRARGAEAWNLTLSDIDLDKGVFIERTKGSLPEWTIFTPRLKEIIESALSLREETLTGLVNQGHVVLKTDHLLLTKWGKPYSKNARDSAWQRVYTKMVYLGYASMDKDKRFSFHDLKAKGVSDHELNESGHKSEKAKAVYLRKVKEVKATK
ncbi:tyrosine-type recombinase/integrase [Thiomicrorhabdus hydrogeniphila]